MVIWTNVENLSDKFNLPLYANEAAASLAINYVWMWMDFSIYIFIRFISTVLDASALNWERAITHIIYFGLQFSVSTYFVRP